MVTSVSRTTRASTRTSTCRDPAHLRACVHAPRVTPVVDQQDAFTLDMPGRVRAQRKGASHIAPPRPGRKPALRRRTAGPFQGVHDHGRTGPPRQSPAKPGRLVEAADGETAKMQGHRHDHICFIQQDSAGLCHPACKRAQPVAPAGAFQVQHQAPGRGVVNDSRPSMAPARRSGNTDCTDFAPSSSAPAACRIGRRQRRSGNGSD